MTRGRALHPRGPGARTPCGCPWRLRGRRHSGWGRALGTCLVPADSKRGGSRALEPTPCSGPARGLLRGAGGPALGTRSALPLGTAARGDSATSSSWHRRPERGWLGAQRGEAAGPAPAGWLPGVAPCPGGPSHGGVTGVVLGCGGQGAAGTHPLQRLAGFDEPWGCRGPLGLSVCPQSVC